MAALPGVRSSWDKFYEYVRNNIQATEELLKQAQLGNNIKLFVNFSSSSVYGNWVDTAVNETARTNPFSPYGVTKLAAETLCKSYYENFHIPLVNLRLFTVYGPGQRSDMGIHKFLKNAYIDKDPIVIFGDGEQRREFTYVNDVIDCCLKLINSEGIFESVVGNTFNIGGGVSVSVNDLMTGIQNMVGKKLKVENSDKMMGDVRNTIADIDKAKKVLGWEPRVSLYEGLKAEWRWVKSIYNKTGELKK